jgi:uncharacterized membrane protein YidH (DUF202 family)
MSPFPFPYQAIWVFIAAVIIVAALVLAVLVYD